MTSRQFSILPPLSFISDVRREAEQATKRIYLQAMEVEPGEISDHLLSVLEEGVKRGLDVRLHVDWYSLLVTDGVFNYLPSLSSAKRKRVAERLKRRKAYFSHLSSLGVKVTFTNPPGILSQVFPMFGRNHIKIAIVDDTTYIGGINYHDANFKSNDCMVKLTDEAIVHEIGTIFHQVETRRLTHDRAIQCSEETTLLLDSGKVGRSLILATAAQLIETAEKSVTVITPIIPDSKLLSALSRAQKRHLAIKVIVPEIKKMKGIYVFLDTFNQLSLSLQFKHLPITFKKQNIHAKMVIIDEQKVLLGSHNLTNRGVIMGTEELAILSKNEYFISQAKAFIDHVLNS